MDVVMLMLADQDKLGEAAPPDVVQAIAGFAMKLASEGKLKGGQQLRGLAEGFRVEPDDPSPRIIDGPYAETKELVAGYLELDVDSMAEAKAIARQCPHLRLGPVMVMPTRPRGAR